MILARIVWNEAHMAAFCRALRETFGDRMRFIACGVRAGYIVLPAGEEKQLRDVARRFEVAVTLIHTRTWRDLPSSALTADFL